MKLNSIIILCSIIFISISCDGQNKSTAQKTKLEEIENVKKPEKITNKMRIDNLKKSMTEYMEIANPSYSKKDVEECGIILNEFLSEINKSNSKEEGLKIVKSAVEKLNNLNNKCESELIETSEREEIADIINLATSSKGYNKYENDITEEWREW